MMTTNIGTALSGWLPYKLQHESSIRWLYIDDLPFTDPFFHETIIKSKQLKENSARQRSTSSDDILAEWSNTIAYVQPSAIIFHVSRCGSTLLAQLLGLDNKHIVLSETPFFDELLRARYKTGGKDMTHLLKAAMSFYGQKRNGEENRLFIKADSWHLFFHEQLRALYPDIPFILLYRRPDEVIASQEKKRGMHAVEGVIESAIFPGELPPFHHNPNHYMAAVLEQYYEKMHQVAEEDSNAYLVNYNEGFVTIASKVYALTGIELSAQMKAAFEVRCSYDAKTPEQKFDAQKTNDVAIPGYMTKAFEWYQKLDATRMGTL